MLGWAVKLCVSGCFPPVSATVFLCPPGKGPDSLTKEFPGVSRGEGRPQDRAQHHVQLEFLPLADELGAVHLGRRGACHGAMAMPTASQPLQAQLRRQQQAEVLKG